MKRWMIVTIAGEPIWPTEETRVCFEGREFVLRPHDGTAAPDVRTEYEHPDGELHAFGAISRLLSSLAWSQQRPIRSVYRMSCTAPMRGGLENVGRAAWRGFQFDEAMALPADEEARRALALYREAMSLSSTPYEFLGYFKIINILFERGLDQREWINRTLPKIADREVQERVRQLAALHPDVGEYLYKDGRCAVAHAFDDPVVDPDDPEPVFRLSSDLCVVRALAEYAIERELGVARGER